MTPLASVRFRHVTIVDEVVDRLLHVHARRDDARLLQGEAGLHLLHVGVQQPGAVELTHDPEDRLTSYRLVAEAAGLAAVPSETSV